MIRYRFSGRFYLGILLVLASLLLGKITLVIFIMNLDDSLLRWASLAVYLVSWPMLIIGVWWVGKEYAESVGKYFSYRYYHESMKKNTQKVYDITKEKTKRLGEEMSNLKKKIISR